MSKADQQFVTMCRDILDHGTTTEGQKVRPVWEDGTPAYTIKNFGVTARYDLREEFSGSYPASYGPQICHGRDPMDLSEEVQ